MKTYKEELTERLHPYLSLFAIVQSPEELRLLGEMIRGGDSYEELTKGFGPPDSNTYTITDLAMVNIAKNIA